MYILPMSLERRFDIKKKPHHRVISASRGLAAGITIYTCYHLIGCTGMEFDLS